MADLNEQLRSYFDAIADEIVDETEASWVLNPSEEHDAVLVPTDVHRPRSVLSRNLVLLAAAIVLLALGVSEETVMQDYLLTNIYTANEIERTLFYLRLWLLSNDDAENVRPLLQVRREYLQAALDIIAEDYGSIDAYLTSALDLDAQDRQRLQALLLD